MQIVPAKLRDPIRLGLQSAIGGIAAYLICQWVGLNQASWSWGVISALFVAHQNIDATAVAAAGRIGAALLGTVVGLATVLAFGGEDLTLLRLAVAAILLNGIATALPNFRFGVVAAVIIALEPDPEILGGAIDRAAAILIGSVTGAAGAFLVWPESAAKRAMRPIRAAIGECRNLLTAEVEVLTGEGERELDPIHRRFLDNIRTARELTDGMRLHRTAENMPVEALVPAVLQLWHTLIILDRLRERQGDPLGTDAPLKDAIGEVREKVCAFLEPPDSGEATADADPARAAIDRAIDATQARRDDEDARAFTFALRELDSDLEKLEELFRKRASTA